MELRMTHMWGGRTGAGWATIVAGAIALGVVVLGCALVVGIEELEDTRTDGGASSGGGSNCTPACGRNMWGSRLGDSAAQFSSGVALDKSGNVLLTGGFAGTITNDDFPLTSNGGFDVLIEKLDPMGHRIWSKAFGDSNNQSGAGIAADASGNIVVAGSFSGVIDLGGGGMAAKGYADIFVAKFEADGNLAWGKTFGDLGDEFATCVTVDQSGHVVVAGQFTGNLDFDGPGGSDPLSSAESFDVFVVRFAPDGSYEWSQRFGGPADQLARGIAVDEDGNVLIAGSSTGDIDFDGTVHVNQGSSDAFVAKLDAQSGARIWSTPLGKTGFQAAKGVAVGVSGDVLVVGDNDGVISLGAGAEDLGTNGGTDVFVAKLDAGGIAVWGRGFGDIGEQMANGVTVDEAGDVLLVGAFKGDINFGGETFHAGSGTDIFVAKLGPDGQHLSSKGFGDGLGFNQGVAIAASGTCDVVIVGNLEGTADLGCGPLTSVGDKDIFVAKLAP